jgi:chromosomal replication initiator protein
MQKTWKKCKKALEKELSSEEYNAWINPLEFSFNKSHSGSKDLFILAPNAFIKEHVRENYDSLIRKNLFKDEVSDFPIVYELSSVHKPLNFKEKNKNINFFLNKENTLNENYTFDTFVEGKSNNIALAAAKQVSESKNAAYNPLFIYGGVGLGKTHLMHAVGNKLKLENKSMNIVYVHSERFVSDMVKCLQLGSINDFKNFYRSVDALLIDDIQFFAGKEQSQEELFHTFNTLLEGGQQMILTCDKYPKEIDGLEERLKSRLGWGLPVSIEPP